MPEPVQSVLTEYGREKLEASVAKAKAQQRMVLRAKIVLLAADGEDNAESPGSSSRVEHRHQVAEAVLRGGHRRAERASKIRPAPVFSPLGPRRGEKTSPCELPATSGVPLSRWSCAELAGRADRAGPSSTSPLHDPAHPRTDAIRPWFHRSWITPRDPAFAVKAATVLELYAGFFEGEPLSPTST